MRSRGARGARGDRCGTQYIPPHRRDPAPVEPVGSDTSVSLDHVDRKQKLLSTAAGEADGWTEHYYRYLTIEDINVSSPNIEDCKLLTRPRAKHSLDTSIRFYASVKDYSFVRIDFYAHGLGLDDENVGHILVWACHSDNIAAANVANPTEAIARFCHDATVDSESATNLLITADRVAVVISLQAVQKPFKLYVQADHLPQGWGR